MNDGGYRRRGDLVGPVLLLAVGVVLLLNNLGLMEWSVWETLFRLWPLILIAWGIDLLLGRRSVVGSAVALLLIVALIGGGVWVAATGAGGAWGVRAADSVPFDYERDGAESLYLALAPGVADLDLEVASDYGGALRGRIERSGGARLSQSFSVEDGVARGDFAATGTWNLLPGEWTPVWDLEISDDLPLELDVDMGVGDARLDFEGVEVEGLLVEMGVGQLRVTLPEDGDFEAELGVDIGQLTIWVPEGGAVRVDAETELGSVNVPSGYDQEGDTYTSPEYEEVGEGIELQLNVDIGQITVRETP